MKVNRHSWLPESCRGSLLLNCRGFHTGPHAMFSPVELFVGLRYTRAKRRNHFISFISLVSMLGIILGVVALIVVLSVMNGFHKEIRERILGMTAHATVQRADGFMPEWHIAMRLASENPEVVGAAPYIQAQAMLTRRGVVSGALLRGIDPEYEGRVSKIASYLKDGMKLDDLRAGKFQIILGVELANVLNAKVGDKVTVVVPETTATPVGAMPRLKRFTVAGLFEVGMGDYDRGVALVHLTDAGRLLRMGTAVTGVRLKLKDMDRAPAVSVQLARDLPGLYRVSDWTWEHRNFFSALAVEKRMMALILSLIVAVAAFNIVSALVMLVTDKQSDIAILRTLGMSAGGVMAVFVIQGVVIGLIGVVIGLLLGVLLAINVERIVAAIEKLFGVHFLDPSIYYISRLPSDLHWDDVSAIAIGAFVLTLLATLYPAWKASRILPAEALRYE